MEPVYKIAQRLHESRAAVGLPKYGRHLDANSQGCMIVHALEESADETNYLIAEIQRRRDALELLIPLADSLKIVGDYGFSDTLTTVIDLLGGRAALAQYDEIPGGGTVAENATVDPRGEALREAEKALALVCYNEDRVTGFDHLIHRMDMEACKDALAAIRAAGGAR